MQTTCLALKLSICYCYITPPGQAQKEHINLANNQLSHNTKIKSGEKIRQSKPPTSSSKTVAQHQVEQWEEKGMETTLLKKIIQYRI
jgi:hypothetical protein